MPKVTFTDLAKAISAQCEILDKFVEERKELETFEPSFSDYVSWQTFIDCINVHGSKDVKEARTNLLDKTADLRDFVLGPAGMVVWPALTYPYQLSTLKILNDFEIPQVIPPGGSKTFSEIAENLAEKKPPLSEDFVTRVIRHASTFHIFAIDEDTKRVSHTAPSQAFLDNPIPPFAPIKTPPYNLQSTLKICLDLKFLNTAFRIGDSLDDDGYIVEPNKTAFNLAFDTKDDYLKYMADDENYDLCTTMLNHLTFVMSGHNMATRHHDQDTLARSVASGMTTTESQLPDLSEIKIVDMGGGWGDVCVSIAKALLPVTAQLPRFVVKDLERMTTNGRDMLPETAEHNQDIIDRITFEEYDFIKGINLPDEADIYMFRFVMHDWSDEYVIKILNNVVPNMKTDARILIMDYIIPKPSEVPLVVERLKRTMDMAAMSILAGKERTEDDWGQLITRFNNDDNNNKRLNFRLWTDKDTENGAFGVVVLSLAP